MPVSIELRSLDFLDGYLFRVMLDILKSEGAQTGLYSYYEARIRGGHALSTYERMIVDYAVERFDPKSRRVVHAGIGIGTLTSVLAVIGYDIAGIEQDMTRFRMADRLRASIMEAWPDVAERYELFPGGYPAIIADTAWMRSDNVLVFTNCGAGWSDELTDQIIATMPSFNDVILDARLFGRIRESDAERQELVSRIERRGLTATAIRQSPSSAFYYHVRPRTVAG